MHMDQSTYLEGSGGIKSFVLGCLNADRVRMLLARILITGMIRR
jgi:hypothetical protein